MLSTLSRNLAGALHPAYYLRELGLEPYDWQVEALDPTIRRLLLLCARQSGKSTIVAGKALHKSKVPQSLILIISPAQDKSKEIMKKIELMMPLDPYLPPLIHDAVYEKEFANGSRIVALPGSEKSVRGYSGPRMIIIDEGARVLDETYRAARPMMVGADTELVVLSTPFGKRGFFWSAWDEGKYWKKILVTIPWALKDGEFVAPPSLTRRRRELRKRGISLYYSGRHTLEFLQEEYDEAGGELWIRQEYLCEFLDIAGGIFTEQDWQDAIDNDLMPLFSKDETIDEELEPLFQEAK